MTIKISKLLLILMMTLWIIGGCDSPTGPSIPESKVESVEIFTSRKFI